MYLKVDKKTGEETRGFLIKKGFFDTTRRIIKEEDTLLIPVTQDPQINGSELVTDVSGGMKKEKPPKSIHEALRGKIPEALLTNLPRSFDLIGDIAVLEIYSELEEYEELIGKTLIETFPGIKVAAKKISCVGTEFRTRRMEVLAGEDRLETLHHEFGCRYHMNVESAYFSPRLGTERNRVACQVKDGERVLVLFAGIGPYAILIAKKRNPSEVVAVELNPEGVRYMKENIRLNKVNVRAIEGDAAEESKKHGVFDRIIMPLPKDAGNFLKHTLPALRAGGIINFYDFSTGPEESSAKVKDMCEGLGYRIKVLDAVRCGTYSPTIYRVCVDFTVV